MNIGIEIELTGVTRKELATAFNNVWGYGAENIWLTRKRYKNSDNSTLGAEFFWDYGIGSDADNLLASISLSTYNCYNMKSKLEHFLHLTSFHILNMPLHNSHYLFSLKLYIDPYSK